MRARILTGALLASSALIGCSRARVPVEPAPVPMTTRSTVPGGLDVARQLVVVTTPDWNATSGMLRRYARETRTGAWTLVGGSTQVVIGRTGLAWADDSMRVSGQPVKREGDGKSPAGVFPLDTAFGFAPRDSMAALRLPYVTLMPGSDCVDDDRSAHYNTVVDRARVAGVDWNSAEHMRQIAVYRIGVIVGYNASPAVPGRGSCIFLHIWGGPSSTTAGCTALDATALDGLMRWLDRDRRPVIVQLPEAEYKRLAGAWELPAR